MLPIKIGNYPSTIPVFIEVAQFSRMKYEWNCKYNTLVLDRVLHSAVFYPHNYGFIPETLCDDGDHLDVLVLSDGPMVPGSSVIVRPICYMVMEDEKGMDEKVLAVIDNDPRYKNINDINDLNKHTLEEISHFFETYKALEKEKWVKVGSWLDVKATHELINKTHNKYIESQKI
tara:strand:- start:1152 stop:1673 length:522 start_codon:yes stop_codon:yes gene_type:complete